MGDGQAAKQNIQAGLLLDLTNPLIWQSFKVICNRYSTQQDAIIAGAIAESYTLFNVLIGRQKLPAHPRDFNLDLPDGQKIARWDFHVVLLSLVRSGLLQNKKHDFPYSRGRPMEQRLGEERRGNPGYYEESELKRIIDECLSDGKILKKINKLILRSDQLRKFIIYSLQTHLYQIRFSENAFRSSNRPAITEYGIRQVVDIDGSWVLVRDLSDQRLDRLSEAYAYRTIQEFKITRGKSLYMLLITSFILVLSSTEKS